MQITNLRLRLYPALAALVLAQQASAQSLPGPSAYGRFGWSVGDAGDVDGDGLADVVVGAPYAFHPSTSQETGAAYVYSASGSLIHAWYGSPGDRFGFSVDGAGDVNGDGTPDLIVGSPEASPPGYLRAGRATVFSGASSAVLFTFDGAIPALHVGYSVAGAGFVNADGFADVLIGTDHESSGGPAFPGGAYVLTGPSGTGLYSWLGDADGVRFGRSVASAGNVNGDGRSDVIVGAPFDASNAGSARVFSGATGSALYTLSSAHPGSFFGASVAGAGDVTGDGLGDVIVGQPDGTISGLVRGTAQVFDGSSGAFVQSWEGDAFGDRFGTAVAGAGDVDRDGRDDLLIGVPGDDTFSTDGGGVRVRSGRTGRLLLSISQGSTAAMEAGHSVAGVGNASSGPGESGLEIAYGGPHANWTGPEAGHVWVYSTPTTYRFALGDGSGTPCPCANGAPGNGCRNPAATGGGRLDGCGSASVTADSMVLVASGLPTSVALLFQGTTQTNDGLGTPFGGGILGVGGSILRLGAQFPTIGGGSTVMCSSGGTGGGAAGAVWPEAGDPPLSVQGLVPALGGARNYQVWYRTAPGCTGTGFNLTNGLSIAWGP